MRGEGGRAVRGIGGSVRLKDVHLALTLTRSGNGEGGHALHLHG